MKGEEGCNHANQRDQVSETAAVPHATSSKNSIPNGTNLAHELLPLSAEEELYCEGHSTLGRPSSTSASTIRVASTATAPPLQSFANPHVMFTSFIAGRFYPTTAQDHPTKLSLINCIIERERYWTFFGPSDILDGRFY